MMKTEFKAAINQLSAERNLPKEAVIAALESALTSAYKKEIFSADQDVLVRIDPSDGKVRVFIRKTVSETVTDRAREVSLKEARKLRDTAQVGEVLEIESTPKDAGRITIQSAKQAVLQRLREAEHRTIYGEFATKEGEVITGTIQLVEPKQTYVRLNKTEAIFPLGEQVNNERYYKGQRLKFYLLKTVRSPRGPQIIVSRSHPSLVRRLFELEIPEVHSGVVELKAIAREAGHRTKVAVSTNQEGVDPVGCCLGPRSIRLQSILNELNGEKIDLIQWHPYPEVFISNALSPAQVASVKINETEKVASVIVPDKQLSLAIGKEGQNARLAAKLTGWRIDIKSVSAAEAEEKARAPQAVVEGPEITAEEATLPGEPPLPEAVSAEEELVPILARDEAVLVSETPIEKPERRQIRFAEDILPTIPMVAKQGKEKSEKAKVKGKGKGHKKQAFHLEGDGYEE